MTCKMLHRYSLGGPSLELEPLDRPTPPNPLQVISSVVTALVAIAGLVTQWKGNRLLAFVLVAIALVASISTFYRPLAMSTRKYLRNLRRNRITRRSWQEFLRVEKRFGTFLNENDTSTCGTSFPRFLAGTQTKICVFTEYEIDCSDIPRLRDIHGRGETLFIR